MVDFRQETVFYFFLVTSLLSTLGAVYFTLKLYWQYLQHWSQPRAQMLVCKFVFLVPGWAVLSFIIIVFPQIRYILYIFLGIVEGYAIMCFMQLIYLYLGGIEQARWKAEFKSSYRCLKCCCYVNPGEKFLRVIHVMIYQFAVTRPLFAVIQCILYYAGLGTSAWAKICILLLFFCMVTCMWGLLQAYRIFAPMLNPFRVGSKFLAMKLYIFLHAMQGILFKALSVFVFVDEDGKLDEDLARNLVYLEYTIFCVELFFAAVANMYLFFPVSEYMEGISSVEKHLLVDDEMEKPSN
eukprot:Lithocolla_globosa_v1_NODE_6538_length_1071_cov_26.997047.p1 type:complete len:295 gc:universal NODE_6538_length_1071_cov_26.997047:1037-153(-)